MILKIILMPVIMFTLVATATFVFATPAFAACSNNGVVNSGGVCTVAYANTPTYRYTNQYRFQNRYYDNREEFIGAFIKYLEELIEQLEEQIAGQVNSGQSEVSVTTLSVSNIDDDEATLRARVYTNNEDEVTVYFEYGNSVSNLDKDTAHRVIENPDGTYVYTTKLTNLDSDEIYYYRAVAEDEAGDEDYGSIYSFRTKEGDGDADNEEPDLDTRSEEEVTDDSAELNGRVAMNDYSDGIVFFVYGEDKNQIEDVADDYDTYEEVEEDGDDLQKIRVDTDLDGSDTYSEEVEDLDNNTRIYYTICVEYEDDDDDEVLACGEVESFTTRN